MGLNTTTSIPTVSTILPDVAKQAILSGQLPQLNTDAIFLRKGELCHFIDKTILLKKKTVKDSGRNFGGFSMRGPIKGTRIRLGRMFAPQEYLVHEQFRGILFITNKRVILQAETNGFSKPHTSLTAITPYQDAVELQYNTKSIMLVVPDGTLIDRVLKLIH
jgi:hypothetical protein